MRQSAGNKVAKRLSASSPARETIEGPVATLLTCVARVRSPLLLKTASRRLEVAFGLLPDGSLSSIAAPRTSRNALPFRLFGGRFPLRYLALGRHHGRQHPLAIIIKRLRTRQQWHAPRTVRAVIAVRTSGGPHEKQGKPIPLKEISGPGNVPFGTSAVVASKFAEEANPEYGAGYGRHLTTPRPDSQVERAILVERTLLLQIILTLFRTGSL